MLTAVVEEGVVEVMYAEVGLPVVFVFVFIFIFVFIFVSVFISVLVVVLVGVVLTVVLLAVLVDLFVSVAAVSLQTRLHMLKIVVVLRRFFRCSSHPYIV